MIYKICDESRKIKKVLPTINTTRFSLSPSKKSKSKTIAKIVHTSTANDE